MYPTFGFQYELPNNLKFPLGRKSHKNPCTQLLFSEPKFDPGYSWKMKVKREILAAVLLLLREERLLSPFIGVPVFQAADHIEIHVPNFWIYSIICFDCVFSNLTRFRSHKTIHVSNFWISTWFGASRTGTPTFRHSCRTRATRCWNKKKRSNIQVGAVASIQITSKSMDPQFLAPFQ